MQWKLELPYPSSINQRLKILYSKTSYSMMARKFSSARKGFRKEVWALFKQSKLPSWGNKMLKMTVEIYCPDKRHRDADGVIKELFDSLEGAGCFDDDYQVKKYTVERMDNIHINGKVVVTIEEMD